MFAYHTPWVIAACWVALVSLTFWATGASSGASLVGLAIAAFVPPAVMVALWKDGPPPTIAEVLYDTERKS
jgi:hypothetical protein